MSDLAQVDLELAEAYGSFYDDPFGFVMFNYEWGEGYLEGFEGPDHWQKDFMLEWGQEIRLRGFDGVKAVKPMRFSTVSGHGIGKSAQSGWITDFIMSCYPYSKGIVTANSAPQLETKTWAEIAKWTKLSKNAHWFRITTGRGSLKMVHVDHEETWRVDGMAWRENFPESFAGLHAANSVPWYLFDEASSIPKSIFDVALGGESDGMPMKFLFGNGTRNSGYFFDTHHVDKDMWNCRSVDSRTSKIANRDTMQSIVDKHGIDSDIAKIRVLGEFPNKGLMQLISGADVDKAKVHKVRPQFERPLVIGIDVARGAADSSGSPDSTVIRFRRGRDASSIPPIEVQGYNGVQIAQIAARKFIEHKASHIFVDANGVGASVVDQLSVMGVPHTGVMVQTAATNLEFWKLGDQIWGEMRDWLEAGASIDDNPDLYRDLTSREFFYHNSNNRIKLESKDDMRARGLPSPDHGDALAMTFAHPVELSRELEGVNEKVEGVDHDPRSQERKYA